MKILEEQAKEVLRQAEELKKSQTENFTKAAFPNVRRAMGGLIANEIVSVQPMSLPGGLIFHW